MIQLPFANVNFFLVNHVYFVNKPTWSIFDIHSENHYLPLMGVRSVEEFEGVLPFPLVAGVDVFLGVEEPKPTGVCL